MKVLTLCEFSGTVRNAFIQAGHEAFSCDLLPCVESHPNHLMMDAFEAIYHRQWNLIIAFPPCTDLCVSGARWFKAKRETGQQQRSIQFFLDMVGAFEELNIKWAIENPVGIMSTYYQKPNQIIQPWQYGHGETKAICLWLSDNLPKLTPTNIVEGRENRIHKMGPSKDRGLKRSIFYSGIAEAMAKQWGNQKKEPPIQETLFN